MSAMPADDVPTLETLIFSMAVRVGLLPAKDPTPEQIEALRRTAEPMVAALDGHPAAHETVREALRGALAKNRRPAQPLTPRIRPLRSAALEAVQFLLIND